MNRELTPELKPRPAGKNVSADATVGDFASSCGNGFLFGCPNTSSTQVTMCTPWSFTSHIPAEALQHGRAFEKWSAKECTDHLFYTTSEGINPAVRCGKKNPVEKLHGVVAEYYCRIADELRQSVYAIAEGLRPSWISDMECLGNMGYDTEVRLI